MKDSVTLILGICIFYVAPTVGAIILLISVAMMLKRF
jgi:hypothetical protein